VCLVGHALLEKGREEGGDAEQPAGDAQGEARRVALQRAHVAAGELVERDRVDENLTCDALATRAGEAERHPGAEIHADDDRPRDAERRQRTLDILALRGEAEIRVEGAVGLPVAEQIDGEGRVPREGEGRPDVPPEKAGCPEAVQQDDRRAAVPVALDVQRAGTDRDAKDVGVDGGTLKTVAWREGCARPRARATPAVIVTGP
jgi:hypothetical protein